MNNDKPLEFLERIWELSEEAAVMVAIAIGQKPASSPDMFHAAWSVAKRRNVLLTCRHCGVAMLDYGRHESCRRQSTRYDFKTWLDVDDSTIDEEDDRP